MRVESDQPGSRVSEVEQELSAPNPDDTRRISPLLVECPFMFSIHKGTVTSVGHTEEACVAVLLEQVMMHLQQEPHDDFRRAYYHLVKAQESLKHHRAA